MEHLMNDHLERADAHAADGYERRDLSIEWSCKIIDFAHDCWPNINVGIGEIEWVVECRLKGGEHELPTCLLVGDGEYSIVGTAQTARLIMWRDYCRLLEMGQRYQNAGETEQLFVGGIGRMLQRNQIARYRRWFEKFLEYVVEENLPL